METGSRQRKTCKESEDWHLRLSWLPGTGSQYEHTPYNKTKTKNSPQWPASLYPVPTMLCSSHRSWSTFWVRWSFLSWSAFIADKKSGPPWKHVIVEWEYAWHLHSRLYHYLPLRCTLVKSFIVNNLQGYAHLVKNKKTFCLLKIILVQRHLIVCVRDSLNEMSPVRSQVPECSVPHWWVCIYSAIKYSSPQRTIRSSKHCLL